MSPPMDTTGLPQPQPSGPATGLVFVPRRLLRASPIILICAAAGLLLGSVLLRHATPRFTSSALIVVDPKPQGAFGAGAEFTNVYIDAAKVASVETVLTSTDLLQSVVAKLHLADDPGFGDARPSGLARFLPFLVQSQKATGPDTPELRRTRAVETLRRMITAARVGATYIIKVDVSAPSASLAQQAAQTLADTYVANVTDAKVQAARRDVLWLADRLREQRDALVRNDAAVQAIKKKFGVMSSDDSTDISIDRQSVKQSDEDLVKAQGDVAAAQARLAQAQSIIQSHGNLESLPDIADSPLIASLRKDDSDAARRMTDALTRYGTGHPLYRQAQHDRQAIQAELSQEVSRVLESLKNQVQTAAAHRDNLARNVGRLMGTINATSTAEGRVELRQAERLAEANRVSYDASLARLRDVEQQQTRIDPEVHVLSGADLPEFPSAPKPAIFLGAGTVLGLLIGTCIAGLLSFQRSRVEDPTAVESDFVLPVLASLPDVRRSRAYRRGMTIPEYLLLNPFSQFADSLRLLRLHLRSVVAGKAQVIQVTSAIPGEGKSTVASSLAMSAATAGISTILLDLDLHQSTVGQMLGHAHGRGLIDVLSGGAEIDAVIQTHARLPIRIINAGSLASLHPGMIEGKPLRDLIARLHQECDLVVIDSPPVLALSDPLYISALVDSTILVVGWRSTPQVFVDNAVSALRSAHAPLAGIVLNRVDPSRIGGYNAQRYHSEMNVMRLAPPASPGVATKALR